MSHTFFIRSVTVSGKGVCGTLVTRCVAVSLCQGWGCEVLWLWGVLSEVLTVRRESDLRSSLDPFDP